MKAAVGTVTLMLFGWALVAAADTRHETVLPTSEVFVHRVVVVEPSDEPEEIATPYADGLIDWVELDRQTDCLWELLQRTQVDVTYEVVVAAGVWTDALGGACRVIGEDDD